MLADPGGPAHLAAVRREPPHAPGRAAPGQPRPGV